MAPIPEPLKICVTCRHLEHLGDTLLVPGLADSLAIRYHCAKFGYETAEPILFPIGTPGTVDLSNDPPRSLCPGWEQWEP